MRKRKRNLSAMVLSLGVHLLFFIVAAFLVTMQVITPEETQFEAAPRSPRKMELKKRQVPVELKQVDLHCVCGEKKIYLSSGDNHDRRHDGDRSALDAWVK